MFAQKLQSSKHVLKIDMHLIDVLKAQWLFSEITVVESFVITTRKKEFYWRVFTPKLSRTNV